MKIALSLFTLAVMCIAEAILVIDHSFDEHWENFKRVYGKSYDAGEERYRKMAWQRNVADVIQHNLEYDLGKHSFRKGINEYSDMSHHEFVETMNGFKRATKNSDSSFYIPPANLVLPDSVDWRKQGLVTEVKNQGPCGACWAFSTTGSLEGQHKKKTGKLVSLSEQNLIDCARPQGNFGCEGGIMDWGFEYVIKNGGIDTEQAYPFTGKDEPCHYKPSGCGATCTGYVDIPTGDEIALQKAVATVGPVSVAIDAGQLSFQLYSGGVYDEPRCSSTELDHAVLVVGYGSEDEQDYWLVKNSWGTTWGESGYIRMARNKNNQCGIATNASYPLV